MTWVCCSRIYGSNFRLISGTVSVTFPQITKQQLKKKCHKSTISTISVIRYETAEGLRAKCRNISEEKFHMKVCAQVYQVNSFNRSHSYVSQSFCLGFNKALFPCQPSNISFYWLEWFLGAADLICEDILSEACAFASENI